MLPIMAYAAVTTNFLGSYSAIEQSTLIPNWCWKYSLFEATTSLQVMHPLPPFCPMLFGYGLAYSRRVYFFVCPAAFSGPQKYHRSSRGIPPITIPPD
jgi:hypothetical protein